MSSILVFNEVQMRQHTCGVISASFSFAFFVVAVVVVVDRAERDKVK